MQEIGISQMKGMKTIRIRDETHGRLRKRGIYGDNMDDILTRILDNLDKLEVQIKALEENLQKEASSS